MGEIYRNAEEVLAWLGSGRHNSHLDGEALACLAALGASGPTENGTLRDRDGDYELVDLSDFTSVYGYLPRGSDDLNELAEMLASSWFERLWTLQEAILSDKLTIGYGEITMPWEQFYDMQRALHILNFEEYWRLHRLSWREAVDPLARIYNIEFCRRQFQTRDLSLSTLFREAHGKKATIAQDKVYALCSLMSPGFRNDIPLDLYATPQRIFIRAAKALIKHEADGLIPLYFAENNPKAPSLPSWVFDLNAPNPPWLLAGLCGYNTGQSRRIRPRPQVTLDDSDDTLGLLGIYVDAISYATRPAIVDFGLTVTDHPSWQKATSVLQWIQACLTATRSALALSEPQALLKLSRIMVCDRPVYSTLPYSRFTDTTSGKLQSVLRTLRQAEKQHPWSWGRAREYYKSIVAFQRGRSFFITQSGYLGIGPHMLRAGDQLVVLHGGEVPFIVRKRQFGSCYELLGECYVDGLMEGQAMPDGRRSRGREQMFVFD